MKDIHEYTAELRQRVELESRSLRRQRARVLALCLSLAVCVLAGALSLPRLLQSKRAAEPDSALPEQASETPAEAPGIPAGGYSPTAPDAADPTDGQSPAEGLTPEDGLENEGVCGSERVPADFSFRFVWGCYGISSYDSETGKLVKTSDATHPEDYITELKLSEAQRAEVWALLSGLELERYPAEYDPYNDPASDRKIASEPSRDLILSLRVGGRETTVSCRGICLGGTAGGYDARAREFLAACDRLTGLLTGTAAWEALPDYEFLYE